MVENENDAIVAEFLVESNEGLDQLDRDLVALEKMPNDAETLARVFRCIHTVKGTCGFLGFSTLEAVAHEGETLLSLLRDGVLPLTPELTTVLLRLVDAVREMLTSIEATGSDGGGDYEDLKAAMVGARTPEGQAVKKRRSRKTVARTPVLEPAVETISIAVPAAAVPAETEPVVDDATAKPADPKGPSAADNSLRVDVNLLDKLMTLVGELVLARNQLLQYAGAHQDAAFLASTQRLNLITTELQEGVMKTRMQPIQNVWSKFPRVVRDLALACGKQVRLEMTGKETELDKTIIEAIKDPLTHIVRNSIDHGIEAPEIRAAAGKTQDGVLSLRAFHEGGQVNIEIRDDGAGIDAERVRAKAVERGLLTTDQAARLSEREVIQLVFEPGFSTAARVTNVSGRGVGMDVVRTNIEKIGGQVDIQTQPGHGTAIRIKIPLTLAIIPALIVTADSDRYAIPQVNLLELVRLEGDQARSAVEMIHGAPVYRLRGQLLPLIYLRRELKLAAAAAGDAVNIVVLQSEGRPFGLVVDGVSDTEEIVVKPLGRQIKHISAYAGTTIMGDGRVALILDVPGLAQLAHAVADGTRDRASAPVQAAGEAANTSRSLLVVQAGPGRYAVPLELVSRLEEFRRDVVENSCGERVVQYRDHIMPLIDLAAALGRGTVAGDAAMQSVVVYSREGRAVGLLVDRVVDIADQHVSLYQDRTRPGILGTAVVQGQVTDLVDLAGLTPARAA